MFYIKTRLNDDTTITTEITPDNVYTRCDVCGRELRVDLYALLDLLADCDDEEEPDCLCRRRGQTFCCARRQHPECYMED